MVGVCHIPKVVTTATEAPPPVTEMTAAMQSLLEDDAGDLDDSVARADPVPVLAPGETKDIKFHKVRLVVKIKIKLESA